MRVETQKTDRPDIQVFGFSLFSRTQWSVFTLSVEINSIRLLWTKPHIGGKTNCVTVA